MDAFNPADPQLVNGASQGLNVLWIWIEVDLGRMVLAQESNHPFVICLLYTSDAADE